MHHKHVFRFITNLAICTSEVVWKRCKVTEVRALNLDSTSCASLDRNVPSTGSRDFTFNPTQIIKAHSSPLIYTDFDCFHSHGEGFA